MCIVRFWPNDRVCGRCPPVLLEGHTLLIDSNDNAKKKRGGGGGGLLSISCQRFNVVCSISLSYLREIIYSKCTCQYV